MYRSVAGDFGRQARLGKNVLKIGFCPILTPKINFSAFLSSEASCDSPIHAILLQIGLNEAELPNKKISETFVMLQ